MIRTILVPTDGSAHANKAVSLAGELAQKHGAKVVLLYALPNIVHENIPDFYRAFAHAEHAQIGDVLIAVGEEILRRAEAELQTQGVHSVTAVLPRAPVVQAILDCARDRDADLIVMGSRGLGNLEGLMLGSVSHKVSHLAPCSCVTVR